jgi:chemotaxis methyl-accepting protein methylase
VDISARALAAARAGRYSPWKLRATPRLSRERWFRDSGGAVTLDERIRAMVVFQQRNLAADNADLWLAGSFDAIFCRNVMLYFTARAAERLMARMIRALAPDGFLFLAAAEQGLGRRAGLRVEERYGSRHLRRTAESAVDEGPG